MSIIDKLEPGRLLHRVPGSGSIFPAESWGDAVLPPVGPNKANVVSSLLPTAKHAPALIIYGRAWTEPVNYNGQEGSYLYIDRAMPWSDYAKLLKVLAEVGLVDESFAEISIAQGRSMVFGREPTLQDHSETPNLTPSFESSLK